MPFTPFKTFVPGQTLTADEMNEQLRDNGNFLYTMLFNNFFPVNLIRDPIPIIWPTSSTLGHYTTGGTAPTLSRDTGVSLLGGGSCQMVGGAGEGYVVQSLLDTDAFLSLFVGQSFGLGCWLYATAASKIKLRIDDGDDVTESDYHTGVTGWEWVSLSHTVGAAATKIEVQVVVASGATVKWQGLTCVLGSSKPLGYIPSPCRYGTLYFPISPVGTDAATFTGKGIYTFQRPALVKEVQLSAWQPPTGQALIVDVNQWTGSANSMFSTRPQIAASATGGSAVPDGTYNYRCFNGKSGADIWNGACSLSLDVDQVGSSEAGEGVSAHVRCLQFESPFEQLMAADDVS